jgi:hypothetical protein
MKAKNIVQHIAIALSLGVAASAHAQLLGGGGLGGSVGGMIGGGMGPMGGIDASSMRRRPPGCRPRTSGEGHGRPGH